MYFRENNNDGSKRAHKRACEHVNLTHGAPHGRHYTKSFTQCFTHYTQCFL